MDYPVIHDTSGVQIHPGSIVKPYRDPREGGIEEPGGVVTRLQDLDVDYNDDTGRPEGFGPFVYVKHDGEDEEIRYDVTDTRKITWSDYMMPTEYDWVCEDIEVEPREPAPTPVLDESHQRVLRSFSRCGVCHQTLENCTCPPDIPF